MKLFVGLILSASCFAAPTVSAISVDAISHSAARVKWTSTGGTTANYIQRIRYGYTTSYEGGAGGGVQFQRNLGVSVYSMALSGLTASQLYHICPQTSDDSGATWSACVDATFTTLAATVPVRPTAPTTWVSTYPNTAGYTTRAVASDCSDLQSKIDAAVANQSVAGSVVTIPAGTVCTGSYTTPIDPAVRSYGTADVNTGTDTFTVTSHGWSNGQQLRAARGGCLPTSNPGSGGFCQLRGSIVQGSVYYVVSSAANTFQLSATSGGAAIDLTDTGSGTNYFVPWPPASSNEVIIRTAAADSAICPAGTRCSKASYSAQYATMRITGGTWSYGTMVFTPGIGAHYIRLGPGIDITNSDASANLSGSTDPRPTYGWMDFAPQNALGYITLDRISGTGLGYPNRIYRPLYEWDGMYMAIQDSEFPEWNFWRPGRSGSGVSFATQTATIASGTYTMRANQACTYGSLTFTRTGGATAATSYIYLAIDCTPTLVVPTGTTATCTGTATDYLGNVRACTVTSAASPDWARDAYGGYGCGPLAQADASAGTWSNAYDPYGYAPSAYITEGTQGMVGGWGPGPYKLENNYSSGAGNLWHFDDSAGVISIANSYTIKRNTFVTPTKLRTNGSDSNGLRYLQRNGIEWKNGVYGLIEGNTWDGFFADVSSTGCAIVFTAIGGGKVSDFEVSYNIFRDGACGILGIGGLPWPIDQYNTTGVAQPFQHFYAHDNVIANTNGYVQYEPQARSSASSFPFYIGYAIEDVLIDHNTLYQIRGPFSQLFHWIVNPFNFTWVTNNILWMNNDDSTYGAQAEWDARTTDPNCNGGISNKTATDCVTKSVYVWRNLWVPFYTDSQNSTGLVDLTTATTNWSGYVSPSAAYLTPGASTSARESAIQFLDAANGDYRLKNGSPYNAGGASNGISTYLQSSTLGADINAARSAQGRVLDPRAISFIAGGVTIAFLAPDTTGCSVDYSTSSTLATFTRAANAGGSRAQSVAITGLTPGLKYFARVNCAVEQPMINFIAM